ncbi:MAG: hypothetical protein ACK5BV_07895 [Bacteroidota bacterium]|jgi:hypothetical protein
MTIELLQGQFSPMEAINLLSGFIQIRIKHHEQQIVQASNEEDIKSRESQIKNLQHELTKLKNEIISMREPIKITSALKIEHI